MSSSRLFSVDISNTVFGQWWLQVIFSGNFSMVNFLELPDGSTTYELFYRSVVEQFINAGYIHRGRVCLEGEWSLQIVDSCCREEGERVNEYQGSGWE